MPTPTYDLIESTALGSSASSITFSSIPSTYRDLVLVIDVIGTDSSVNTLYARFNSDSGSNYNSVSLYGTSGDIAGSNAGSNQTEMNISDRSNAGFSNTRRALYIVNFLDYSVTNKHKQMLQRANSTSAGETVAQTHRWASTSAISSMVLTPYVGSFGSGSVFSLYGIVS
jgi:hypothetical protein